MITPSEEQYIFERAYVPEHLPHYVCSVSNAETFLIGEFIVYLRDDSLTFIGYPLDGSSDRKKIADAFEASIERYQPRKAIFISPVSVGIVREPSEIYTDQYYRLNTDLLEIPPKVKNMIRRAKRELEVGIARSLEKEHRWIISGFVRDHPLSRNMEKIIQSIPDYVSSSTTVKVIEVRNRNGELVAFDIGEFGARHYAFYMFNFRARAKHVPGASDLLLSELIRWAEEEGKTYINLGLGINRGIAFFKRKWGATPFLNHYSCIYRLRPEGETDSLLRKL